MNILFYVLSTLFLLCFTSLVRHLYLFYSKTVEHQAKANLSPYDIGSYMKNLRNKNSHLKHSTPKINAVSSTSMSSSDTLNSNTSSSNTSGTEKSNIHQLPVTPVIADSAIAGASIFHRYLAVDTHLYEGISRMSGEQINNFSDLSAKLKDYARDSEGLTEGALNKLKGHVAESHVAEHFKEAGIDVQWAEASNQEGWDLLLNDNQVQVKLVKDASSLTKHFKGHSDIPVVIPADADNIPETATAFHFDPSEGVDGLNSFLEDNPTNGVIVDHSLSNEAVTESVHSLSKEAVTEGVEAGSDFALGEVGGFSLPLFTAAFSGYREINLLRKNNTDIESALVNVGLDCVGTGVGMSGGAALGATIGSIIPGPGTVIGGVAGGLIGGLFGRGFTNEIKEEPLREAMKKLKRVFKKFQKVSKETGQQYEDQFHQYKQSEQKRLNQIASEAKIKINSKVQDLTEWTILKEKPSTELKQKLLNNIPDSTVEITKAFSWIEYFWPSQEFVIYEKNKQFIQDLKESFAKDFKNNKYKDRGLLFQAFAQKGLCRQFILSEIEKTERERHNREDHIVQQVKEAEKAILNQRVQSMKGLSDQVKVYVEQIREALHPYIKNIQKQQNIVIKEAKKLGKKPNLKKSHLKMAA